MTTLCRGGKTLLSRKESELVWVKLGRSQGQQQKSPCSSSAVALLPGTAENRYSSGRRQLALSRANPGGFKVSTGAIEAPGTTWLKSHLQSCYCLFFLRERLCPFLNDDTTRVESSKSKLPSTARYIQCKDLRLI